MPGSSARASRAYPLDLGSEHVAVDKGPVDAAVRGVGVVLEAQPHCPGPGRHWSTSVPDTRQRPRSYRSRQSLRHCGANGMSALKFFLAFAG